MGLRRLVGSKVHWTHLLSSGFIHWWVHSWMVISLWGPARGRRLQEEYLWRPCLPHPSSRSLPSACHKVRSGNPKSSYCIPSPHEASTKSLSHFQLKCEPLAVWLEPNLFHESFCALYTASKDHEIKISRDWTITSPSRESFPLSAVVMSCCRRL